MVQRTLRLAAIACCVAIAVLSLLPGDARPHTGFPGKLEHFVAYAGTGLVFALGCFEPRRRLAFWLGLGIASGLFEVLQNFVPGRSPSVFDALASILGLSCGLLAGVAVAGSLNRPTQA